MREKRCAQCGRTFGCGQDEGHCWCAELPSLPATALEASRDCLCPACLRARLAALVSARRHASDPDPAA